LVAARTQDDAIEATVRFCSDAVDLSGALWVMDHSERVFRLAGMWGMDAAVLGSVDLTLARLPADPLDDFASTVAVFSGLCGLPGARAVPAERVLLVHADDARGEAALLASAVDLLDEALTRIDGDAGGGDMAFGLALTAHELRTPVQGAHAAVGMLLERARALGEDERLLAAAERDLADLSERVDQLLRWAVGTRPPILLPGDLAAVVRDAAAARSPKDAPGRISIEGVRRLIAPIDAAHMRWAVENLLSNALTYSPRRQPVRVTLLRKDDRAVVRVRDHGPGIPAEERECVLDPFGRGCSGRRKGGNGLGLFIANRIVQEHGGELRFRRAPGGGTCFTISLQTA
jgi:signal transduction histidine kinase